MEIFPCGLFFLVLHIVIYQSALIPKKTLLPYNIPGYAPEGATLKHYMISIYSKNLSSHIFLLSLSKRAKQMTCKERKRCADYKLKISEKKIIWRYRHIKFSFEVVKSFLKLKTKKAKAALETGFLCSF